MKLNQKTHATTFHMSYLLIYFHKDKFGISKSMGCTFKRQGWRMKEPNILQQQTQYIGPNKRKGVSNNNLQQIKLVLFGARDVMKYYNLVGQPHFPQESLFELRSQLGLLL